MNITVNMVQDLRKKTNAGIMDCKNALKETNGNLKFAIDWLRKNGLAKIITKQNNTAIEGLIAIKSTNKSAVIIEVNSETDFTTLNLKFQQMVSNILDISFINNANYNSIQLANYLDTGKSVKEFIKESSAIIGEKINFRRVKNLNINNGIISTYIHNAVTPNISGKIGVLVALESSGDPNKLNLFGKQLAMHIAATNPIALDIKDLDPTIINNEKNIFKKTVSTFGKSNDILKKIIEGRMHKYYQEVVLLKQIFIIDGKNTIEKTIEITAKKIKSDIKLTGFIRMELGENIEKNKKF